MTILGIVASITVPGIIQRQTEKANKTKIKKALATYEAVINKIVVANNHIRSVDSLNEFGKNDANCSNAMSYFKATEQEGCVFRTADGLWWDIGENGTMARTMVAFKKEDLTTAKAQEGTDKTAFYFVTDFDNSRNLRTYDYQYYYDNRYSSNRYNLFDTAKIKNYLTGSEGSAEDTRCTEFKTTNCSGYNPKGNWVVVNDNGQLIEQSYNCDENGENCTKIQHRTYDDETGKQISKIFCDTEKCTGGYFYNYEDTTLDNGEEGYIQIQKWCDTNGENCNLKEFKQAHVYDKNNNMLLMYSSCDDDGKNCETCEDKNLDDDITCGTR